MSCANWSRGALSIAFKFSGFCLLTSDRFMNVSKTSMFLLMSSFARFAIFIIVLFSFIVL